MKTRTKNTTMKKIKLSALNETMNIVDNDYLPLQTVSGLSKIAYKNIPTLQNAKDYSSKMIVDVLRGANIVSSLSTYTLGNGWQLVNNILQNISWSQYNHCASPQFNLTAGKKYVLAGFVDEISGVGVLRVNNIQYGTAVANINVYKGQNALVFISQYSGAHEIRVFGNISTSYKIKDIEVFAPILA